jgi:hypothetical protein
MKSFQWKVWWDDRAVVWQYAIHNFPFFCVDPLTGNSGLQVTFSMDMSPPMGKFPVSSGYSFEGHVRPH